MTELRYRLGCKDGLLYCMSITVPLFEISGQGLFVLCGWLVEEGG
jgi:hypothetical protein